ncbi:restriction endonuclease [Burkholderia sola]|uniref:restriction endonuclease n=1 Tax=Burkholderia sola TaxID=2843302 RepID=UPI0023DD9128|nr:restriction endonuclease [Burkholderia sola]MDF3082087.1 restriction endonuclease [Burkholderia sola]
MYSAQHPGHRFEELVADLFRRIQPGRVMSNVEFPGELGHDFGVDILFGESANMTVAEIKLYRYSSPPQVEVFVGALRQTQEIKRRTGAKQGILVIGCPLTVALAEAANAYSEIEVWDANLLFKHASAFPDLAKGFEQLFEVSAPVVSEMQRDNLEHENERAAQKDGEKLSVKLKSIKPGRPDSKAFEDASIEALRYLFESDLHGWHEQLETEDGLHRRDLVCRILPKSEVWRLMLNDLHSRYVVFEFKNYSEPITQYEVVTTERYLYPSALRNVAIIISPDGCSKSAEKVIRGAMREHGKLIISMTVDELDKLLIEKDNGEDPNTYLFQRVDDFLLSLGR